MKLRKALSDMTKLKFTTTMMMEDPSGVQSVTQEYHSPIRIVYFIDFHKV